MELDEAPDHVFIGSVQITASSWAGSLCQPALQAFLSKQAVTAFDAAGQGRDLHADSRHSLDFPAKGRL
jgi:hypothetical protein